MIAAGYLYKKVKNRPDWLDALHVKDIYSVSGCISENFVDYNNFWKHNGYWLFDSPGIMEEIAAENGIDLSGCKLFYYEVYENEYDEVQEYWCPFKKEESFTTDVRIPETRELKGYDIVSFSVHTSPECSPLSCNSLAKEIKVNEHCLLATFKLAKSVLEHGKMQSCEPGPYRIFAVYET